ncbi:ADP-ribosylglycohydrolase family protein [Dactylosporangium sp. NPDC050688]|uniref:ADP-ribosylglycohydrolase family protein n=1 Tax=Dactylosporangium sp. NPDC050688 TaxID=3157217 RepID=UPI0033D2A241
MVDRRDRVAGGLLGVHAGDALGATVEFSSWASIRDRYPDGLRDVVGGGPFGWSPGDATDDTDLTRAVLLAYLSPGEDVVRAAADNMVAWLRGEWPGRRPGAEPRDIGGATRAGLVRYLQTGDPRASGAGLGRADNGSLMRCIPTALAVTDQSRRIRESMEISAITHDDPRCTVACAAYNEIAAALLAGAAPDAAVMVGQAVATRLIQPAAVEAIGYGRQLRPAMLAVTGQTFLADDAAGYVLDSLSLAVAAVLDARPLVEVLVDIVRIGNDTDTNAAIAGGLLGVRDGASAIPTEWLSLLQFADEFITAADALRSQ